MRGVFFLSNELTLFLFWVRLLLYGVVCTLSERNEAAETFFEAATCVDPKSILAWTMLGNEVIHLRWQCCVLFNKVFEHFCMWYFPGTGLFYDAVNNEIGAEMAYLEANKLNQAAAVAEAKALREEERLARGEHESEDKGQAQGHMQGCTDITLKKNLLFSSNIKFIMNTWKYYQRWCLVTFSFIKKRRGHVLVF